MASRRSEFTGSTAPRKGSTYWTQPRPSMPIISNRGSDLWTSKPGRRELWSYVTYAVSTGKSKAVKIFVLETTMENKKRFVGPTFRTPQEAKKHCVDNDLAWPGDQKTLDLDKVRTEGLLKAWSEVWSPDVEQCVRTSAESAEKFVETFNIVGSGIHVKVPKTFTDQLLLQIHREPGANNPSKYGRMGGYFFPDRPSPLHEDDEDFEQVKQKENDKAKEKQHLETEKVLEKEKEKEKPKEKLIRWGRKKEKEKEKKEKMDQENDKDKEKTPDADKPPEERPDSEDAAPSQPNPHDVPETPVHRRVYAFATITVDTAEHKAMKYAFVRSRIRGDHYFIAVTPDFGDEELDELTAFFEKDEAPFPEFEFDAKWMLEELGGSTTTPGSSRSQSLF